MNASRKQAQSKLNQGLIHYYYGNGNGKTSIGLGHIIRAIGHNYKPVLIQFLKKHDPEGIEGYFSGEYVVFTSLIPIQIHQFGNFGFVRTKEQIQDNKVHAQQGLDKLKEILLDPENDLVILDEIGSMISLELFDPMEIKDILKSKLQHIEVIMTGHDMIPEFNDILDYCVKLKSEKHPFQQGIQGRAGIEF